jgi:hypothetical protein
MDRLLSSQPLEDFSSERDPRGVRARATVEGPGHAVMCTSRLTLTPEQLHELTGYKRGAEQARWLKENGFKFRLDRLGKPRVDRAHYETKMGCKLATTGDRIDGGSPNWAALLGA